MTAALVVDGVHVSFGGVRALAGTSISVELGAIVGIIGANGAGKTTLFDVISGFVRPDAGAIRLGGVNVTGASIRRRVLLGLGRGFQDAGLYGALTVREVLSISCSRRMGVRGLVSALVMSPSARRRERTVGAAVDELVDSFGLADFANKFVFELSTGTRRIVELACLAAQRPSVLLLDEPSSGIAQREVEALGRVIIGIQARLGCALLVIEHDIPLVSSLARELVAMESGGVLVRGTPTRVLNDERVVAAYLGTNSAAVERSGAVR